MYKYINMIQICNIIYLQILQKYLSYTLTNKFEFYTNVITFFLLLQTN